jgi:two-component system, NtrC family, nitrogen regulation sensor histidine kinase NtrY
MSAGRHDAALTASLGIPLRASLPSQPSLVANLWSRLRQVDFERRLALLLTISAVAAGLATYWVISRSPPYGPDVGTVLVLLNLDLILLLLLGVVIARRLVQLVFQLRQGSAGSRLHTRLVLLFSGVAVTPAIIVVIFSVFFLSSGLENWFSERVRNALDNSLAVAQAYLQEHKENIRADALAMAADLNRESASLDFSSARLRQVVNAQAALRSLTEAIVFDGSGRVLARTGLSFTMEVDQIPVDKIEQASAGNVVEVDSDTEDRVRALVRLDGFGDAYLFVGRFVDAKVLGYMERTQTMVAEYQRMQSERSGIQITSALIFMIVALLLLFASVWIGLGLANQLVAPISRLITAANRVRSGDLLARVPEEGPDTDEFVMLSRAFNRMTTQLESQRRELIQANQQLDERSRFTETVLAGVSAGVIGTDADRRIALPNRAAQDFLDEDGQGLTGRTIQEALPGAATLLDDADQHPGEVVERQLTIFRGRRQRTLLVRVAPQLDGGRTQGYIVTFDDITALLSAQRQAAWAEVARRIAHEVKNPLTPIRLSAERLERKYLKQINEDRDSFTNSIATIIRQVDTIGRLINEFSAFARMPAPVLREENLGELVRDAVFLQQSAWPRIQFTVELPAKPVRVVCDGQKLTQALTNLLQNSINALSEGQRPPPWTVVVRVREHEATVQVEVEDNGQGFPADGERLFEPYVTTRAKGTGLGLAIVKKIMEEHGGTVELLAGEMGGALVRLGFPVRGN